jgi:sulfite exporter TauE/SafE/plastocyanin domain-containing protein/copper chaperone CopZ
MSHLKKLKLKVHGTHCASCEVLIERKFKKLDGVEKVHVSFGSGKAEVFASRDISLRELQGALHGENYSVARWEDRHSVATAHRRNSLGDYFEIGGAFLALVSLYYILKQFDLLPTFAIVDNMSYWVVFLIGLVAAFSTCIAVVGGLLLAVAGKYNEMHPELSGFQKFKPHIYFNIGRVVSYTVLGGLVGALGSAVTLSPQFNGYLVVIVSVVMLFLGFQLLHIFPWLRRFSPKMPKFLAHKIHELGASDSKAAPFVLGGATFFLPCGFTQALQLYVLATGDWKVGALTMLVFSLGTLPALVSLSAITSFAKGTFQRLFLKFAGALVVLLAIFNINNGLTLAGIPIGIPNFGGGGIAQAETTPIVDGKQVIRMLVNGYTYTPNRFTVTAGIPVEWQIDGRNAVGCGQVLVMPTIGVTKYLSKDAVTIVRFTPQETGEIPFNCSMGMMSRGSGFTVVPNTTGAVAADVSDPEAIPECDPNIASCLPKPEAQKFALTVTNEQGFYPNTFTVKKDIPVEVEIDAKVPLGGCMSVMVIPQYDVTMPLKLGKQTLAFTPTKTGTVYATCSMGIEMLQFNVVDS